MRALVKPLMVFGFMGAGAVVVPGSASAFGPGFTFGFGVPYYGYYRYPWRAYGYPAYWGAYAHGYRPYYWRPRYYGYRPYYWRPYSYGFYGYRPYWRYRYGYRPYWGYRRYGWYGYRPHWGYRRYGWYGYRPYLRRNYRL